MLISPDPLLESEGVAPRAIARLHPNDTPTYTAMLDHYRGEGKRRTVRILPVCGRWERRGVVRLTIARLTHPPSHYTPIHTQEKLDLYTINVTNFLPQIAR